MENRIKQMLEKIKLASKKTGIPTESIINRRFKDSKISIQTTNKLFKLLRS